MMMVNKAKRVRKNGQERQKKMGPIVVLGIETSCDDTSMAVIRGHVEPQLLSHHSFSQESILKRWGGVVPEIAARNHMEKVIPILCMALEGAQVKLEDIDLIGVTALPGLLGPLLTGINLAKSLSLFLEVPIVPVNHLFAHLEAVFLTASEISYPYLGLLVSGGHSIYFWVTATNDFELLGQTIDDAAGEAFDKGGRLLGLPYPAGKFIDQISVFGDPYSYTFPIGLKEEHGCNLSFSGVKTSLKNFLEKNPEFVQMARQLEIGDLVGDRGNVNFPPQELANLCASYQMSIIKALILKMNRAIDQVESLRKTKTSFPIVVGGGVAANRTLRTEICRSFVNYDVHFVAPEFCTDNGAMIAHYAYKIESRQSPSLNVCKLMRQQNICCHSTCCHSVS
ncbi:MAG: tRNA (adenosine(37)-N6)-threonylcarbamoyltransferase complex transferase subunit TsaD, partial [Oligoflexia bacterium]|nr:tRNA (adenosine(37)-N6)-threonylcarbamoyltransferase complex transferase subunit TsaD [Oligoflexia bacterium]